jgi:hypothetical protein
MSNNVAVQNEVCKKWGSPYVETPCAQKVGIAENVKLGIYPINGLRHSPTGDTSGWYIWAGEDFSEHDDFFVPLHAEHLQEWCPAIEKYLGLAPGWRFLVAPKYEDVWFDASLLSK